MVSCVDSIVLDTKLKKLNSYNPSPDDLSKLYVYHDYFGAKKEALVIHGKQIEIKANYFHHDNSGINSENECSIILSPLKKIKLWQKKIGERFEKC